MIKIRNNFPSNVKEERLINENPVVVDALTTWNNEVSQLCVEMEGSIIINKTAESKTKDRYTIISILNLRIFSPLLKIP